ncbi:MAG: hypothetical protein GY866_33005 [Proteobacteria bacterium]|nr:hypothetical protein [Pseudomonadota bacterium]
MSSMQKSENPKPGDEIPDLTKAVYVAGKSDSRNVIHTDDYAEQYGLKGALVEGSTLLCQVVQMLFGHFGSNWFEHGRIKVSYIGGGAIDGEVLTARGRIKERLMEKDRTRQKLDIWLENRNREKILVGQASCLE